MEWKKGFKGFSIYCTSEMSRMIEAKMRADKEWIEFINLLMGLKWLEDEKDIHKVEFYFKDKPYKTFTIKSWSIGPLWFTIKFINDGVEQEEEISGIDLYNRLRDMSISVKSRIIKYQKSDEKYPIISNHFGPISTD